MAQNTTLKIRLTDELLTELTIKSKSLKMNNSEFIRNAISNTTITYKDNKKDIQQIVNAMNRIGNNINQIAHTLNIAKNANELNNIQYDNLLDKLTILTAHMKELTNVC